MSKNTDATQNHHKRATRTDVARLAGVSTAVVSYVFNNGPRAVAPATMEKVRKAAAMLDYRPSSTARALRTGHTKTLGIIGNYSTNPYNASIYDNIQASATRKGYTVPFINVRNNVELETVAIDKLIERNVDAIFLSSLRNDVQLRTADLNVSRFVLLDQPHKVPNAKCVSTDLFTSAKVATTHLLNHGYESVDMLFGGSREESTDARIQGWYAAHQEANKPAGRIAYSSFTRKGGYQATLELIDSGQQPRAIFAGSDMEAMGALRALHERGLRIPQDVAIVSFDGTVDSLYTWPQLTTMQQDTAKIAACAMKAALTPDETPDVQLIKASLVVRHSCGC